MVGRSAIAAPATPTAPWRKYVAWALLVGLAISAGGCVTVKPWQRSRLSHAWMTLEPRPGDGFVDHVRAVREGSVGGRAGAGGGCGCN